MSLRDKLHELSAVDLPVLCQRVFLNPDEGPRNHKGGKGVPEDGVEFFLFNGSHIKAVQFLPCFIEDTATTLHTVHPAERVLDFLELDAMAHILDLKVFPPAEVQFPVRSVFPEIAGSVDHLRPGAVQRIDRKG